MLELALRYGDGPVMMETIASCQRVSRKYLHSLLTGLRAAGLVRSVRGAGGGFVLARKPSDIHLVEVIETLEGSVMLVDCVLDGDLCAYSNMCVARDVWSLLGKAIKGVLQEMSLRDLVEKQKMKEHHQPLMYHI